MTYPHRQRAPGILLCECGALAGTGPTSTWGADCPVAMRERIAELQATLRDLRAQLDYIAHVGWDASCESAAADALEAEDATRLNRYAVRVAGERGEARAAALHEAVAVLRRLSNDYAAGHRDHHDYCRVLSVATARIEALTTPARESEPAPPATTIYDVEGDL